MIDFIDSPNDYSEFSESSIELDYTNYTAEQDGFSDSYLDFLRKTQVI